MFVEEAPIFAPQSGSFSRYQKYCKGAMGQYARVYRNFGLGLTVITQRASALDKNILTQCPTLLAMRVSARFDRRALLDWGAANTVEVDSRKDLDELAAVQTGQGISWCGGRRALVAHEKPPGTPVGRICAVGPAVPKVVAYRVLAEP